MRMGQIARIRKILLLINLSRASGRRMLSGVLREMSSHPEWQLRIMQVQEMSPDLIVETLRSGGFDGIISSEMEVREVSDYLEADDIPLVVTGTRRSCIPKRGKAVSFIRFEEEAIGEQGADYLTSLGAFKIFGFIHYSEKAYAYLSSLRKKGFRRKVESEGLNWTSYGDPKNSDIRDRQELERYLSGLPRPAALMVGCDKRAVEVLDACSRLKIRVPDDISLISVDNDELLCHSTNPSLSSIETAVDEAGAQAVRDLARLMKQSARKRARTTRILRPSCTVVERGSSAALPPGLHLAREALRFISANASRELKVADVVSHLGVSRRLADLRFREFQHETLLSASTRTRLDEVARRLKDDDAPIRTIMRICGFRNAGHLESLFHRRFGVTMRDYRRGTESADHTP